MIKVKIDLDDPNFSDEKKQWVKKWREKAKSAKDDALTAFKDGKDIAFKGDIWSEFKNWIIENKIVSNCSYCESKITPGFFGEGEHYRPKGRVTIEVNGKRQIISERGYFWLAYDEKNLLLACQKCNNGKSDLFNVNKKHLLDPDPSSGQLDKDEAPCLINPAEVDPADYFSFGAGGSIAAKGSNADAVYTIKVLDLDRSALRDERGRVQNIARNLLQSNLGRIAKKEVTAREVLIDVISNGGTYTAAADAIIWETLMEGIMGLQSNIHGKPGEAPNDKPNI